MVGDDATLVDVLCDKSPLLLHLMNGGGIYNTLFNKYLMVLRIFYICYVSRLMIGELESKDFWEHHSFTVLKIH